MQIAQNYEKYSEINSLQQENNQTSQKIILSNLQIYQQYNDIWYTVKNLLQSIKDSETNILKRITQIKQKQWSKSELLETENDQKLKTITDDEFLEIFKKQNYIPDRFLKDNNKNKNQQNNQVEIWYYQYHEI